MTNDLVTYEEKIATLARQYAREAQTASPFISANNGKLAFQEYKFPGNQMAVVILDAIQENLYYPNAYDPDVIVPPTCYAFGRLKEEIGPHESMQTHSYFEPQHEDCTGCRHNVYGTSARGRGKACRNMTRLAVIPAGVYAQRNKASTEYDLDLFTDEEHFLKTDILFLKIAPTSKKACEKHILKVAQELQRPPFGVFTRIWLEDDANDQHHTLFEVIDKAPGSLIPILLARHEQARANIVTPFQPPQENAPPRGRGGVAGLRR